MKFCRWAALLLAAAVFLAAPANLESCGPFIAQAVFTFSLAPLAHAEEYRRGQLGVVTPTYTVRDLFVAYRYFSGVPLTAAEEAAIAPSQAVPFKGTQTFVPTGADLWAEARKAAGAPRQDPVRPERIVSSPGHYEVYLNCLDDSFHTAAATLTGRSAKWGRNSANLKEWIAGQDQVFLNCNGPEEIPGPVKGADALLAADRQYQRAAAAFYAGDWELARKSFDEVAANPASPWRTMVPYLKARVSIREATVAGNPEAYARAERELTALGTSAAQALLGYVTAQQHPGDRLAKVSAELSEPRPGPATARALNEFVFLEYKLHSKPGRGTADLSDWVETYQQRKFDHALEKWRATSSVPWLVAALAAVKKGDAAIPELLTAVAGVAPSSPASATVNYHAVELEIAGGAWDAARLRADTLLKQPLPVGSRNLFLAERLRLATNWAEFLKYAPRVPEGESYDDMEGRLSRKLTAMLDYDATRWFNTSVPLARWMDAAESSALPGGVRDDLASSGWTRAIVLGDESKAHVLAAIVRERRPELAKAMQDYLAAGKETAHFTAIYWLLKMPGLAPVIAPGFGREVKIPVLDPIRDNWWALRPAEPPAPAMFLQEAEREQGIHEWQAVLAAAPHGPNYAAAEAVRFVKAHPGDRRAAEALALAVRATHLSTSNAQTGAISKEAFDLLHANYPSSTYARDTKYWYK